MEPHVEEGDAARPRRPIHHRGQEVHRGAPRAGRIGMRLDTRSHIGIHVEHLVEHLIARRQRRPHDRRVQSPKAGAGLIFDPEVRSVFDVAPQYRLSVERLTLLDRQAGDGAQLARLVDAAPVGIEDLSAQTGVFEGLRYVTQLRVLGKRRVPTCRQMSLVSVHGPTLPRRGHRLAQFAVRGTHVVGRAPASPRTRPHKASRLAALAWDYPVCLVYLGLCAVLTCECPGHH